MSYEYESFKTEVLIVFLINFSIVIGVTICKLNFQNVQNQNLHELVQSLCFTEIKICFSSVLVDVNVGKVNLNCNLQPILLSESDVLPYIVVLVAVLLIKTKTIKNLPLF